jgi:hypothetical protein
MIWTTEKTTVNKIAASTSLHQNGIKHGYFLQKFGRWRKIFSGKQYVDRKTPMFSGVNSS